MLLREIAQKCEIIDKNPQSTITSAKHNYIKTLERIQMRNSLIDIQLNQTGTITLGIIETVLQEKAMWAIRFRGAIQAQIRDLPQVIEVLQTQIKRVLAKLLK